MHEIVEQQAENRSVLDDEKDIKWEALREQCMKLGARDALDRAMNKPGHVVFDYLWFLIVCWGLLFLVGKIGGCQDADDRAMGSGTKAEVVR